METKSLSTPALLLQLLVMSQFTCSLVVNFRNFLKLWKILFPTNLPLRNFYWFTDAKTTMISYFWFVLAFLLLLFLVAFWSLVFDLFVLSSILLFCFYFFWLLSSPCILRISLFSFSFLCKPIRRILGI